MSLSVVHHKDIGFTFSTVTPYKGMIGFFVFPFQYIFPSFNNFVFIVNQNRLLVKILQHLIRVENCKTSFLGPFLHIFET